MLKLEMLPARCGDSLWLEYGTATESRIVIIDGGLTDSAEFLHKRLARARDERGGGTLHIELLVVTHIDNDHILGIIELLKNAPDWLKIKDIWFNGRPQLMRLAINHASDDTGDGDADSVPSDDLPADLMGGMSSTADDEPQSLSALAAPTDLLGTRQGDDLSELLETLNLPWNKNNQWGGEVVMLPGEDQFPVVNLTGDLKLTMLGPTLSRLKRLCAKWTDVLGGIDEPATSRSSGPADLLGRSDTWPPTWQDKKPRDPSVANGSSIMFLAEYDGKSLLLVGDAHAPDIVNGLEHIRQERGLDLVPLDAFKLPHHASANNVTKKILDLIECERYLVSTDGSNHKHPDHLALLRILKFSKLKPKLMFNYESDTTLPWRIKKNDVVNGPFQNYDTEFPIKADDGLIIDFKT